MAAKDATSQHIALLHNRVKQLLKNGNSEESVMQQLGSEGLSRDYVQTIFENLSKEESDQKSFRNSLMMGVFYIFAGLLINFFSYRAAVQNGSLFFYAFWGVLVVGIVTIIRGVILYKH